MDSLNVPKKRGRKSKIKTEPTEVKVLKKRGRKPKNVILVENENEDEIKIPKKRGRKPKKKIYSVVKVDNLSTINNNENIILHLPIKSDDTMDITNGISNSNINQGLFEYNPTIPPIPTPYNNMNKVIYKTVKNDDVDNSEAQINNSEAPFNNSEAPFNNSEAPFNDNSLFNNCDAPINNCDAPINDNSLFNNSEVPINNSEIPINNSEVPINDQLPNNAIFLNNTELSYKKITYSMNKLYEQTKNKTWPVSTTIACWWCCHNFDNSPVGIPCSLKNNTFSVYGCFCSYNCAMSHIFSNNNSNNSWEEFSLLKLLYKKMNNATSQLKCAPPKEILELFGGTVNINEYRNSFKVNNISYRYITPPIISIISQIIEEKKNINQKNTGEIKNILQISNSFRLQRSKPLVSSKNSLEATMGIKIK